MSARRKPREPGNFYPFGYVDRIPLALLHPEERAALEATFGPIGRLVDDSLQVSLPQVRYAWDIRPANADLARVQAEGSDDERAQIAESWRAGVIYMLANRLIQELVPSAGHTSHDGFRRAAFVKGASAGIDMPLSVIVPRLGALRKRLMALQPNRKPRYVYRNGQWLIANSRSAA